MTTRWQLEKSELDAVKSIKAKIEHGQTELDQAKRRGDFERASRLQYGELRELETQLAAAESSFARRQAEGTAMVKEEVDSEQIAEVVAKWTGIPLTKLIESEREKLLHMEKELALRVVGQHEAVTAVCEAVRRNRAGLGEPNRPIGSFLFLGPTGVGKTELCKALASYLFDTQEAMVRIDMSEYMEQHEDESMSEAHVRGILNMHFRPELLNRIDETVIFRALTREQLTGVVEIQLSSLRRRLAARGMTLGVTAGATEALVSEGYDPQFGARPLKRVIQHRIENALAGKILGGELKEGDSIRVDYQGKSFTFQKIVAPTEQVR